MRDKDAAAMLRALAPVASAIILTRASNPRAADPSALADEAQRAGGGAEIVVEPAVGDALAAAWRRAPRIVVAGSIFLLADVMNELNRS
jgi:folylpolyglutamate synthase/dihydropteroate synthase